MAERRKVFGELERKQILDKSCRALWNDTGQEALQYLRDCRNIPETVIKKFQLGYVPHWVKYKDSRHELAGRITIPIINQYEDLIAFASRDWRDGSGLKHWHESFKKGIYLYGLNIAKRFIFYSGKAIIVEGEFDVLSLYSKGIKTAVGFLGSAPQMQQIALLSRYCRKIYIAFDMDKAGVSAAKKMKKMIHEYKFREIFDLDIYIVNLPEGSDPDEFVQKYGKESFISLCENSEDKVDSVI
jgi:DNA primase